MQKESQDETQFTTQKKKKKLVEKLVWVPVNFRLVKTSSYFLANFWTEFASVFLPI